MNLMNPHQCEFDHRVIMVLKCLVTDQHMKLTDGEGNTYESSCKMISDNLSETRITKNGEQIARIFYDYDKDQESWLQPIEEATIK